MLACKGIFATPSIGIRSRKTAGELKTRRSFAKQKSVYANYTIQIQAFQYLTVFIIFFYMQHKYQNHQ